MSNVNVSREGAVGTIQIHRPEKRNALTIAMYDEMTAGLASFAADSAIRVVVMKGVPGAFTAGNDLGDFMQSPPNGEDSPVFRFLLALIEYEKPIIASVDGAAVGIGTTMLLHCDYVVATTTTKFRMPFVPLGIVPEAASSILLPAVVGLAKASEWLLLGDVFTGQDAHAAGLVNTIVDAGELEAKTAEIAGKFAEKPPKAVRLSKKLLRDPQREKVRETLSKEGMIFLERLQAPETMEAMMRFMMKGKG